MSALTIKATKPQAEFLTMPHKYRLFCAGFGAGKSEAMASAAIIDAAKSSDSLIGCYAPTYGLIKLITLPRIQQKLSEYGIRYKYNQLDSALYTSTGGFGDFILRTLDNPSKIVGYETFTAHVDELDTLRTDHARHAWNQVIARNRQRPKGMADPFNQASAYTTPEGFKFCYDRWITNANEYYGMVQASTYSNPYLPADYIDSLKATYPASLIEAYIDGRFVNLTSGAVYPEWSRKRNGSSAIESEEETLHIGMDFNVYNMSACIMVMRGQDPFITCELSGIRDTPAMIEALQERYPNNRLVIYPDASGRNASSKGASLTDINLLRQVFTVRARASNPRIKDRVMSVNALISSGALRVNIERCPELVEGLQQQAYDKNGMPDKTSGVDHILDAMGYVLYWHYPINKPSLQLIESTGI